MRVTSEASKRFPGVRYVTVSAQSRHIQESAPLFRAKDLPVRDRARRLPLEPKHRTHKGNELRQEEMIARIKVGKDSESLRFRRRRFK